MKLNFLFGAALSFCTGLLYAQEAPIEPVSPLRNPERGYHVECNYFVHNFVNPFDASEKYPETFIDNRLERCQAEGDSLTLTQLYLYLSDYVDRDLPPEAFDHMQTIFDDVKTHGFKVILRFAYNYKGLNAYGGETEESIMRHLEQLRPFLQKNNGLIATCQVGFIGAWGEWHTSPLSQNQEAKNRLVNTLLDIFPKEYCLQLRYPKQKRPLKLKHPEDWRRIGFANDYFTAGEHSHAPENDFVPGDDNYNMVLQDAAYFFMSGEIPYAENTEWGLHDLISVDRSLQILRDHHYSAFDITQNTELNIRHWKHYALYPEKLDSLQIPYDISYFRNAQGKMVSRSAYDFIRDHLGYRLYLTKASLDKEGGQLVYSIGLKNTGFATVVNPHPVYLLLINAEDEVVSKVRLEGVCAKDWQPYRQTSGNYETIPYTLKGKIPLSLEAGTYRVAIWMPDAQTSLQHCPLYDIRWVEENGLQHWSNGQYLANIIGKIKW
ncbi:MAG TPA: DUF4874 domain-containing protein [Candidatus Bacteroides intestinavium]|uniref:DUF4874 domain-containing protein n=1 Tax=Candidatus Bacteroides intestinavium TaxID=2838469 RepID=A0A9D2HRR8_9BACE|nr:DUF4874 domain-containing protein [Candidatus Bacteroides intestinavium]